jgi:Undecaprenyl-phosphate glucose phosphotransferase
MTCYSSFRGMVQDWFCLRRYRVEAHSRFAHVGDRNIFNDGIEMTAVQITQQGETGNAAAQVRRGSPAMLEVWNGLLRVTETGSVFVSGLALTWLLHDELALGDTASYARASFLGMLVFGSVSELAGSYDSDVRFSLRIGWGRIMSAWLAAIVAMLALGFFLKVSGDFSRAWATGWFATEVGVLCFIRAAGTMWMRNLKSQGFFNQRVAIFGAGVQGNRLAGYILGNNNLTIDLVGFFDERPVSRLPKRSSNIALAGNLDALISNIRTGDIDQVIVALPLSAEDRLQEIVARLSMLPVLIRLAPDLASFAFAQRPVVMLGDLPVMTLFERPISGIDRFTKKLEDMILATLILILVSPVILATSLAVILESHGPVFFRQEREGYNHRKFPIWKFRSMYADLSQPNDIDQVKRNDPRVTRVGRFIRATSIDELPQLFNVLRGEMSLVGPRPHAASTRVGSQLFTDAVASYAARHKVKPGLTGWAQVNGWRGETDTEQKLIKRLEYDLFYIENWSVAFDLYIIARTAATVLFSRRAY